MHRTWDKRIKVIRILATALKDYDAKTNNPIRKFEKEYGCKLSFNDEGNISGVSFNNKGAESMFYLKYDKQR